MTMSNDYTNDSNELPPNAIAVIGMAGRFPGARFGDDVLGQPVPR